MEDSGGMAVAMPGMLGVGQVPTWLHYLAVRPATAATLGPDLYHRHRDRMWVRH